ncbi:hypothetical protein EXS72_01055 [Candidatus Pacearchaeota archaeon]|nr:hypothetical protein [Candidatus Pacearchaeota archaeon]
MVQKDISELFLINFLQSIISASAYAIEKKSNNDRIWALEGEKKPNQVMFPQSLQSSQKVFNLNRSVQSKTFQSNPLSSTTLKKPIETKINSNLAIDKLNFLIRDPSVTEIECSDSEKNILVKKGGSVQRTSVKLSIEEVYQLIGEFSQKTKIPVIDGTIKTAFNNLILTAVLSETLGPRFIIQKKNPFKQLVQN